MRLTTEPMLMMLAPSPKMLCRRLGDEQQAEHVDVELLVEMLLGELASMGAKSRTRRSLLTRMSRRPKFWMAASMMPCASAALETSPPTATALPPALEISSTILSAPDLLDA